MASQEKCSGWMGFPLAQLRQLVALAGRKRPSTRNRRSIAARSSAESVRQGLAGRRGGSSLNFLRIHPWCRGRERPSSPFLHGPEPETRAGMRRRSPGDRDTGALRMGP